MVKKITIDQLKPGMYISDLNCSWFTHPFVVNQFKINDMATVRKVAELGIRELYIDPTKGDDLKSAPTRAAEDTKIEKKLQEVAKESPPPPMEDKATFLKEATVALKLKSEATNIVRNVMEDIRLGKQVEVERTEAVVDQMVESVFRNRNALASLCRIKRKDQYTFFHSVSVCALLTSFAKSMGIDKEKIREIATGGLLHDIGKMKVPDSILNKPDQLSDFEFTIMKDHTVESCKILELSGGFTKDQMMIATQHHERIDGSGYPAGLSADEINPFAKMAAIVDVYDALTSERCYHKAMEPAEALKKIYAWSKYHLDKDLVHQFIQSVGIYPIGTLVLLKSGLLGVVVDVAKQKLTQPVVKVFYNTKKERYEMPKVIDLSLPSAGGDYVLRQELYENWKVKPIALEEIISMK